MENIQYFRYEKDNKFKTKYVRNGKSDSNILPNTLYISNNQNAVRNVVKGRRKPNLITSSKGVYETGIYLDSEIQTKGFADNKNKEKNDLFLIEISKNLELIEIYVLENSLNFQNQYFQLFLIQDSDLMEKLQNAKQININS